LTVTKNTHFGDQLFNKIREKESFLCLGLDPHLNLIPKVFQKKNKINCSISSLDNIKIVEKFCFSILESCLNLVPAVKLQIAFFEQLGPLGMKVFSDICFFIKKSNTLCIIDAKRGDIGSTNKAYSNTFFGKDTPYPCDALTLNPWLGLDSIKTFTEMVEDNKGLFILVHTSNQGSNDIQDKTLVNKIKVYDHLANLLKPIIEKYEGKSGLSSVGIVAGATYKNQIISLRKKLKSAPFLIPGYGAQGGSIEDARHGLKKDKKHNNLFNFGVINSSRSLCFPNHAKNCNTLYDWQKTIKENLLQTNLKMKSV